jgi:hypothetical protein
MYLTILPAIIADTEKGAIWYFKQMDSAQASLSLVF